MTMQGNFLRFVKPSTTNHNYPTPAERESARHLESVITWLQIEVDELNRQARVLGTPTPRQQAIINDLNLAIHSTQEAQRYLRHEGD